MPQFVEQRVLQRMSQFSSSEGMVPVRLFVHICGGLLLSREEVEEFVEKALEAVLRRRVVCNQGFLRRRVRQACERYVWCTMDLMDRLLDQLEFTTTTSSST